MNRKSLKIIIAFGMILLINLLFNNVSEAALNITSSKSSVEPGENFQITVSVSNIEAGHISLSAQNASLSSTNIDLMSTNSQTVTCTAGNSGTITIAASGKVANYSTETETNQNASKNIEIKAPTPTPEPTPEPTPTTVQNNNTENTNNNSGSNHSTPTPKPATKSSNNKLSNLGIKPKEYDFTGFKANTTEYSLTVPNDVAEVTVYANAQDNKAKITGTGEMQLEVGSNKAKVVCTAEDGGTKTYTINITREEKAAEQPVQEPEEQLPEETETTPVITGITKLELIGKNEKGESILTELSPAFEETTSEYVVYVPLSVVEVEVKTESTDEKTQIEVMGNKDLKDGTNIVTVIAKTEESTKVYQITVNKIAQTAGSLSQELLTQLAIIAAIITAVIVAIIAIILMIIKNSKKGKEEKVEKSTIEISKEILEEDETNNKEE